MKKMYISFIAILMIAAVAVWNVELANANDQATSLPGSSFTTTDAVINNYYPANWVYSIRHKKEVCRFWGIEPETGQRCYIDYEVTKIECPLGNFACFPTMGCNTGSILYGYTL
jgi:hypothetical protein